MRVRLDYDRHGLDIEVPDANLLDVIDMPAAKPTGKPEDIIRKALCDPIGTPALSEIARGRRSACVVVPDITRPMPIRLVLPPVLEAIEKAGVARSEILILIATGLHRVTKRAELEEMVGDEVLSAGYRIEDHIARDAQNHADLGVVSTGVPALIDRRYVEADLKVLLGLVEPHFMAGYSGGRKLICPGIAAEKTIQRFHGPELIEHPKSANGLLEGNPTHQTSAEVARLAGVDFTINVVLNSSRELLAAFAGGLDEAFQAAASAAAHVTSSTIKAQADIVIVSGGGYPLDVTWYQTIKGVVTAVPAVREGGTIIAAGGLREGVGSPDFESLMGEFNDLEVFMKRIRQPDFFRVDQWELELLAMASRHAEILLYSDGLPMSKQQTLFVTPVASVEAGIAQALSKHGKDATIAVMPHGPYVVPVLRP